MQAQARYIRVLGGQSVWPSVVLVVKEGKPNRESNLQGVYAACQRKIRAHQFTCITWLPQDEREAILSDFEGNDSGRVRQGNLFAHEVKQQLGKTLEDLPSIAVLLQNCKCTRCGEIGDRRLLESGLVKCSYHEPAVWQHAPVGSIKKHRNNGQDGTIEYPHTGYYSHQHLGRLVNATATNVMTGIGHFATFGVATLIHAAANDGDVFHSKWSCCDRYENRDCAHGHYTCCGRDSSKCRFGRWSCCKGAESAPPCRSFCPVCNEDSEGKGCRLVCSHCGKSPKEAPCRKKIKHDLVHVSSDS